MSAKIFHSISKQPNAGIEAVRGGVNDPLATQSGAEPVEPQVDPGA